MLKRKGEEIKKINEFFVPKNDRGRFVRKLKEMIK